MNAGIRCDNGVYVSFSWSGVVGLTLRVVDWGYNRVLRSITVDLYVSRYVLCVYVMNASRFDCDLVVI